MIIFHDHHDFFMITMMIIDYIPGWFYVGSDNNNLRFISRCGEKTYSKGSFHFNTFLNAHVNSGNLREHGDKN